MVLKKGTRAHERERPADKREWRADKREWHAHERECPADERERHAHERECPAEERERPAYKKERPATQKHIISTQMQMIFWARAILSRPPAIRIRRKRNKKKSQLLGTL